MPDQSPEPTPAFTVTPRSEQHRKQLRRLIRLVKGNRRARVKPLTLGQAAEVMGLASRQTAWDILRRGGLRVGNIRKHLRKERPPKPPAERVRCIHCGQHLHLLVGSARPGPHFCVSNERGCRSAYRRWRYGVDIEHRRHVRAQARARYQAARGLPVMPVPGPNAVQRCANCGVTLKTVSPSRPVRFCAQPACNFLARRRYKRDGRLPQAA